MLVYLDNNPYDHLRAAGLSAPSISARLEAHGHELIISGDNFQEWASCWKSGRPEKERVGRELLRYAFAITPRKLLAGPDQLIPREMAASLGRRLPGPFLPPDDVATAEDLIRRFIDGKATAADRAALLKRWTAKESSVDQAHEVAGRWTQKDTSPSLAAFIAAHPEGYERTVRAYIRKNFHPINTTQMKFFAKRLHKCPALQAAIRADLYVNWRLAAGKKMQHDRWDDLRHCISSSYADLFVTRDDELKNAFDQIKPGPRIMTVAEFAQMLRLPYSGP